MSVKKSKLSLQIKRHIFSYCCCVCKWKLVISLKLIEPMSKRWLDEFISVLDIAFHIINKAINWNIGTFTEMNFIHWRCWGKCNDFLLSKKMAIHFSLLLIFKSCFKVNSNDYFDGGAGFMQTKPFFFYINVFYGRFLIAPCVKTFPSRRNIGIWGLFETNVYGYMSWLCSLICTWIKWTYNSNGPNLQ